MVKSTERLQLVVDPDVATAQVLEAAALEVEKLGKIQVSPRTRIKRAVSRTFHPLGVHHYVPFLSFDPLSKRIIEWPGYFVCEWCAKGIIDAESKDG